MSGAGFWGESEVLPPITYRQGDRATFLAELLDALRQQPIGSAHPLAHLDVDDPADWTVALAGAWAELAEVVSFYQERIINEAFLGTATLPGAVTRLFHSLGHDLPPNVSASSLIAYTATSTTAGFEAVARNRAAGTGARPNERAASAAGAASSGAGGSTPSGTTSAGATAPRPAGGAAGAAVAARTAGSTADALGRQATVPQHAQVRAVAKQDQLPPTYSTLAPVDVHVGASNLAVAVAGATASPPVLGSTTQLTLAGAATGLTTGMPVVVSGRDPLAGGPVRWARILTSVAADAPTGTTRVGWTTSLDAARPDRVLVQDVVVTGFGKAVALFGADAVAWSSLSADAQLAVPATDGGALPRRGGVLASADGGQSWTTRSTGLPAGAAPASLAVLGSTVLLGCSTGGLFVSTDGGPFASTGQGTLRRATLFVGGTPERILAGTATGDVYQSVDDGQTWSAIRGGPPTLNPSSVTKRAGASLRTATEQLGSLVTAVVTKGADPAAQAPASNDATPAPTKVVPSQLPSVPVRAVLELTGHLYAGTDAGTFRYDKQVWVPDGLSHAVFALTTIGGTLVAATDRGPYQRTASDADAPGEWKPYGTGLTGRVYAVATGNGTYAGTDTGVWRTSGATGMWSSVSGDGTNGLPSGVAVLALVASGSTLVAGTAGHGVYRSTDGGTNWARTDTMAAFRVVATLPTSAAPVPEAIAEAFADNGLPLPLGSTLTVAGGVGQLTTTAGTFVLTPTTGGALLVELLEAFGTVRSLALDAGGAPVLAADQGGALAQEWPGLAVQGSTVTLGAAVSTLVPGMCAVLDQSVDGTHVTTVVDVTDVAQARATGFGRTSSVTTLTIAEAIPSGTFPLRATAAWVGPSAQVLASGPAASVSTLTGDAIPLTTAVAIPHPAGRLAVVTGKPIGVVVAGAGGAVRMRGDDVSDLGPVAADAADVEVLAGSALVATDEGVFRFDAASPTTATPAATAWPSGAAATALATTGGTVLAGTSAGVLRLAPGATAWTTAGLGGVDVARLAADTTVVAATATGAVLRTSDPTAASPAWAPLGPLGGPAVGLATRGDDVWAATSHGVSTLATDGAWAATPALPSAPACMTVDDRGWVWVGTATGIYSLRPAGDAWAQDQALPIAGPVVAVHWDPTRGLLAATPSGVATRSDGAWQVVGAPVAGTVTGLRAAPDGSIWLATSATTMVVPGDGTGAVPLGRRRLFDGPLVDLTDIATLDQRGMPGGLAGAFAEAGSPLDAKTLEVTVLRPGAAWLVASTADRYVVALRPGAAGSTVAVFGDLASADAMAPPTSTSGVETWTVEAGGVTGSFRVPVGAVVQLPAAAGAPNLAETATLAAISSTASTAPSTLQLAAPLTHLYDATTVAIQLNVAPAAHGQRVRRPIGSGDPGIPHQSFSVPTPVAEVTDPVVGGPPTTTLAVTVAGLPWHEVRTLLGSGPNDHVYQVQRSHDGTAVVQFGDGVRGSRLPAGQSNVVAHYLEGGGAAGDTPAGTVIQPLTRPQLVTAVHNPVPASRPPLPAPRRAALAAVRTLGRIVTLDDHAEAAHADPGVRSAAAQLLSSTHGRYVVVSVAAAPGAPATLLDDVAATLADESGAGIATRVVAARVVPVQVAVEVLPSSDAPPDLDLAVAAALADVAATAPGAPLLASQVVDAATRVPGVAGARLAGWERDGRQPGNASRLAPAGAAWPAATAEPTGAELLVLDTRPGGIAVTVDRMPRETSR